jgi:hypothetical protein
MYAINSIQFLGLALKAAKGNKLKNTICIRKVNFAISSSTYVAMLLPTYH